MAAIFLRPGHSDPAALAHGAGELGIEAGPGLRPLHRFACGEFGLQEIPDLLSKRLGFRGRRGRWKSKRGHGRTFRDGYPRVARGLGGVNVPISNDHGAYSDRKREKDRVSAPPIGMI